MMIQNWTLKQHRNLKQNDVEMLYPSVKIRINIKSNWACKHACGFKRRVHCKHYNNRLSQITHYNNRHIVNHHIEHPSVILNNNCLTETIISWKTIFQFMNVMKYLHCRTNFEFCGEALEQLILDFL
jgi:hypothetical protein